MILGYFWCERDRSWLRLSLEDGIASAAIAPSSKAWKWEAVVEDVWPTNYIYENGKTEPQKNCYSLKNGVLYCTSGSVGPFSKDLWISVLKESSWQPYNALRGGFDPFPDYKTKLAKWAELILDQEVPLTPEMIAEIAELVKQKQEQAQEKRESRQKEEEKEKWGNYQKENNRIRKLGMKAANPNSFFNQEEQELLYELLDDEVGNLLRDLVQSFDSCAAYLQALKNIVGNSANPTHKTIVKVAARTDVEWEEIFLVKKNTKEYRAAWLRNKKSFFFNLLREEAKYLSKNFGIEYTILEAELIVEKRQLSPQAVINCVDASLDETNFLIEVKNAVVLAQGNYQRWYNKEEKDLRGADGFFSRWSFRHGDFGQQRAIDLNQEILNTDELGLAMVLVNSFLQDNKTRYHRHSFASFLLDELTQIKGEDNPWRAIISDKNSNCYNKETVIEQLNSEQNLALF